MRGLINPVLDRALEHDPKLRRLILKLEQQACQARDQTLDDTVSSENGTAIPSSASGPPGARIRSRLLGHETDPRGF